MTYKLARSIRELVNQLNTTWVLGPYVCALECKTKTEDSWACHLFQEKYTNDFKSEIWALAIAIEKTGCNIHITESTYNRGTTKEEIVESIKIY